MITIYSCPKCGLLFWCSFSRSFTAAVDEKSACECARESARSGHGLKPEVTIIDREFLDSSLTAAGEKQLESLAERIAIIVSRNILLSDSRLYAGHKLYSSAGECY